MIARKGAEATVKAKCGIHNPEFVLANNRAKQPKAIAIAAQPEACLKRRNTFKAIGHQRGEKNSQFGKPRLLEVKLKIAATLAKRNRDKLTG